MRTRIAAVMVASAGLVAVSGAPSWAATAPAPATPAACAAVVNQPCAWQVRDGGGVVGTARVTAAQPGQLTFVRVEVRSQKAWGSPWQTIASSTRVQPGSFQLSTPRIATDERTIVCATAGPALDVSQHVTTCTTPY